MTRERCHTLPYFLVILSFCHLVILSRLGETDGFENPSAVERAGIVHL